MKKQSKSEKPQLNLRIEPEFHERLVELGKMCGLTKNQFVIESMKRYGDVLAEAVLEEDQEIEETRARHRDRLREKIQSSRR